MLDESCPSLSSENLKVENDIALTEAVEINGGRIPRYNDKSPSLATMYFKQSKDPANCGRACILTYLKC